MISILFFWTSWADASSTFVPLQKSPLRKPLISQKSSSKNLPSSLENPSTKPSQKDDPKKSSSKNKFRPFKNIFSFEFSNYGSKTHSSHFRLASPPIKSKNHFFLSQFKYTLSDHQFETFGAIEFQKFSVFTLYKNQLNPRWHIISVLPFSFATQAGQSLFAGHGFSIVGSINLEKTFKKYSTIGGGIVVIKRAQFLLVVPNFSFTYTPEHLKWQLRLGFPQLEWIYPLFQGLLTSFLKWDLNTYAIRPQSNIDLSPESKFIKMDQILLGIKIQYPLASWLSSSVAVGKILSEKIHFSDMKSNKIPNFKIKRDNQEKFFLNLSLALGF